MIGASVFRYRNSWYRNESPIVYGEEAQNQIRSYMKRALIVKLGAIGDVVMAVAAGHELYRAGFEIDWVCGPTVKPLLECYSWIKTIVIDEKAIFAGNAKGRAMAVLKLWKSLSGQHYDICAVLYYDYRYRILVPPWIARRKVYLSHKSREYLLLPSRHHADDIARILLGHLDSAQVETVPTVCPDFLPKAPLKAKSAPLRIGIVPGGASNLIREQALRRWPLESYVALAKSLIERGWEILLLGGPDDVWVKESFERLTVVDCIGALSLPEFVSTCDTCDAVISHDTGPLHLAGLSSAALIGLFGPTQPRTRMPRKRNVSSIWGGERFACTPCYDGRNFAPCLNNACMQEITPQRVLQELDILLEQNSPQAARREFASFPILRHVSRS
jgi:heptosyltransferase-2